MGASWIPQAIGIASGVAGIVQGNQTKQKNKGLISQAYRQNVAQTNLQQANTREDSNEALNARGVLSAGAQRSGPSTMAQQVANSGVEIPGTNVSTDIIPQKTQDAIRQAYVSSGGALGPYAAQAGAGAVGASNTLSGGANQQMTDQFALQDKSNKDAETQALNQNQASYDNTILSSIAGGVGAAGNIMQGNAAGSSAAAIAASQQPGSIVQPSGSTMSGGPMTGQYGAVNPQFSSPSSGTKIGSSQTPNYSFNVG